jgi:hypothetical protein
VIEHLYIVSYFAGVAIGFVGPVKTTEAKCWEIAIRSQMSQPMNGGRIVEFVCEWRQGKPRLGDHQQ